MQLSKRHSWTLAPADAIRLQRELAREIIDDQPLPLESIRTVAGVDVSVRNNTSQAAIVVLAYPDLTVIETVRAQMPTPYPYIPGLLTFREGPVLDTAFARLQNTPDVLIFDGMGRIHPRRIGIASHMGLLLDRPSIGCGKTHFVGTYVEPGIEAGSSVPLIDRGEQIGVILRTKTKVKPVYISVGHRADLASAVTLILRCTTRYRLPEPIRAAHNAAGAFEADTGVL